MSFCWIRGTFFQQLQLFFARHWFCDQIGQVSRVYHGKFVERAGRCHIQELDITVFCRIVFSRRIIEYHRVELQALCVFHGKDHDPLREYCSLKIAVRKAELPAKSFLYMGRACLIPADDCDRLPAV